MRVSLGQLQDLPQGRGVRVETSGHRIALFRIADDAYAIGDRCSHAEASLAEGEVFDLDVECPRHGSEFNLETGLPNSFPATRPVPTYEVAVVDGELFIELEPIVADE
ncbi:MAG: non-heme iron oxygenase ferredoxin subunit [Acidimicrobiia bacterium]